MGRLHCGSNCKGKHFEDEVEDLLHLIGYRTWRNRQLSGMDADLYAELPAGLKTTRVIVECKAQRHVSVSAISKFNGLFASLRGRGLVDHGIFVTSDPIENQNLLRFAEDNDIETLSFPELLSRILDFREYCSRLVHDFENYDEYRMGHRRPLIDAMRRADLLRNYTPLRGRSLDGSQIESLDDFFSAWLEDDQRNHLTLLGDPGTGKTSFCLRLAYDLARRHEADPVNNPVPLYIPLADASGQPASSRDIQALILRLLRERYSMHLSGFAAIRRLLDAGKIMVIFDGFDEMATRSTFGHMLRSFKEIAQLVGPSTKTIVTCRTSYFRTGDDARNLFSPEYDTELMRQIRDYPQFEIVFVDDLSPAQVRRFVESRVGDASSVMSAIEQTYNLRDLARRPLFLDMIVQTVGQVGTGASETEGASAGALYRQYVDLWLELEERRSSIESESKLTFMETLANRMFFDQVETLQDEDLREVISEYLATDAATDGDLDRYEHAVRTCSFLMTDDEGRCSFMHRSFLEYFVASKLVREIRRRCETPFLAEFYSQEIGYFAASLLTENEFGGLFDWLASGPPRNVAHNLLRIVAARKWDNAYVIRRLREYCAEQEDIDLRSQSAEVAYVLGDSTPLTDYISFAVTLNVSHSPDTPEEDRLLTYEDPPFDKRHDDLQEQLLAGLSRCRSDVVRRQFMLWLCLFRDSRAVEPMLDVLRSPSASTRAKRYAASSLGLLPCRDEAMRHEVLDALSEGVGSSSPSLRADCQKAMDRQRREQK